MAATDTTPNATCRIIRFWTKMDPMSAFDEKMNRWVPVLDEDGKQKFKAVDMVEYAPIGRSVAQSTTASVSSLSKLKPRDGYDTNPAIKMAWDRWERIEPAYRAWKTGQQIPVSGTPLSAWHGVTQEQCEHLRYLGINSVEELSQLSDGIVSKFPFPGGRDLQAMAKKYLEAAGTNKIVAKNAELEAQLEEMRKIVLEMQAQSQAQATEDPPKRRGRPPKTEESAAA